MGGKKQGFKCDVLALQIYSHYLALHHLVAFVSTTPTLPVCVMLLSVLQPLDKGMSHVGTDVLEDSKLTTLILSLICLPVCLSSFAHSLSFIP